ncbi:MAG: aspartate ammonia-lyase, partial [Thermoguttaceae bacterium]|nr:aspartate ammonia-lyase [Thermoguttaceae bacterium]
LKAVAVTLFNVANNIRFLGSGPRCGYNEIVLPDLQPGSSIMPGKINPVLCESLMQVCARVMGNDFAISHAGAACGQFQLNIGMPFMGATALESIKLLANATDVFTKRCLTGLQANADKCSDAIEKSLSMVTGLNPYIGYEKAAKLAKQAFAENKTIRQLCKELDVLPEEQLNAALDPSRMAGKE